jgi:Fur family peroxide stress response transcriptional regulator
LVKNKFKLTNQRIIILDYLRENYNHPSVEDIFQSVRNKLPRISKKTVYSNLQFLCDKDLINEIMIKGVQRYESKSDPHPHLICRKCNKIIDIESKELFSHAMEVGRRIEGFDVDFFNLNFYGICKDCKEVGKNGRNDK